MPKTRSTYTILKDVLQLPEGAEVTGVNVDGENLVITATPEGNDMSGSIVRFRHEGNWAQRVEWRTKEE